MAFLSSATAHALIFDSDDRETASSAPHSLFAPIGIVFGTPEAGYATAFLIDDCHALTSQHAFGISAKAIGRTATFAADVAGARSNWVTSSAIVVAAGGIEKYRDAEHNDAARGDDWALLLLKKCLGKRFGHVRLKTALPREILGLPLESAGYPIDRPLSAGLVLDPTCRVRVVRPTVWLHDCAALPGSSGSPLFGRVRDGQETVLEVYAIHSAGIDVPRRIMPFLDQYPGIYANRATPVTQLILSAVRLRSGAHRRGSAEPLGDATVMTAGSAVVLTKAESAIATPSTSPRRCLGCLHGAMHAVPTRIDVGISSTYDR